MMQKGPGIASSLVIISRRMLIASVVCTALCSFALGYFFGYGGGTAGRVEADSKAAPSEERTVLDKTGKPTLVPPPALPALMPKEPPVAQRKDDQAALKKPEEPATPQEQEKKVLPETKPEPKVGAKPEPKLEERVEKAMREAEVVPKQATAAGNKLNNKKDMKQNSEKTLAGGKSASAAKKKASSAKKELAGRYALQVGAFSEKEKAERLAAALAERGRKASLSLYKAKDGNTLTRVRIGPFKTRQEALDTAARLRGDGVETILVIASR